MSLNTSAQITGTKLFCSFTFLPTWSHCVGSTAQWLALLPHSKKVLGTWLDRGRAPPPCSPCVCVGSTWVIRLPPTIQRQIQKVKLSVGVNGCLSLCVLVCQPCDELATYPDCIPLLAQYQLGLRPPDPEKVKRLQMIDGWNILNFLGTNQAISQEHYK